MLEINLFNFLSGAYMKANLLVKASDFYQPEILSSFSFKTGQFQLSVTLEKCFQLNKKVDSMVSIIKIRIKAFS